MTASTIGLSPSMNGREVSALLRQEMQSVAIADGLNKKLAIDRIEDLANDQIESGHAIKAVVKQLKATRDTNLSWPPPAATEPVEPTAERAEVIRWLDELVARMNEPDSKSVAVQTPLLTLAGLTVLICITAPDRYEPKAPDSAAKKEALA